MPERMIPCPVCDGKKTVWTIEKSGIEVEWDCSGCWGTGTIPDRRKPTANDRAAERILAEDEAQGSGCYVDRYTQGYGDGVEHCAGIIREEAERHE